MIPRNEVAVIRSEIQRLEKARNDCTDSGLQQRIDVWIEEHKQKLVAEEGPRAPASPRPGENTRSRASTRL